MAGSSEEDRERQRARFQKQVRHWHTHDEELARRQQAKERRAARRGARRRTPDDDEATFAKMRPQPQRRVARAAADADTDATARGVVTAVHLSRVEVDGGPARVAPALLADPEQRLVVGDEVGLADGDPPRVVARLPRRSALSRPDPGQTHRELVLAANVDVGVVVAAAQDPPLRPGLIDRFLVALRRGGIAPLLAVNKVDLLDVAGRAELDRTLAPHAATGVPIVCCSATNGEHLDALRAHLHGRTCVFVGHSGVGKSSLLNALDPDGARHTAAVRAGDGKGRHTTTASRLWQLAGGTRVIDTPGVRAFGIAEPTPDELAAAFPDLAALARGCRFADCSHRHEPDCAVRAAVATGQLAAARYRSFVRLGDGDGD